MKRFLTAILLVGMLAMTGCGNQAQTQQPAEQKAEQAKPDFEKAVEPAKEAVSDVKNAAENVAADAKDKAEGVATDAQNLATDAKDKAENMASDAVDQAKDLATGAVDAAKGIVEELPKPDMISSAPSIGSTREMFEMYSDEQYVATYDDQGRVVSMEINTPYIDNDLLASILPSDVSITSFDTNNSDATKQVNHFQGTSEQLKLINPASGGRFEAFTNFDKQTSQFLGGTISIK